MKPRELDVFFAFPAYGGNGGISSEVPDIRKWMCSILMGMKHDDRIGKITDLTVGDTPITMVRNRFVVEARKVNADVLIMVDSDMNPMKHAREPEFKEFFSSSFDFLYEHYDKGPCVIGAPYCGPPGGIGSQNMYVFEWQNYGDWGADTPFSLEQVPRAMAARMRGIQEAAALPTGLIMYDMRAFELIEPSGMTRSDVLDELIEGKITKKEALKKLNEGWFYYEWSDSTASGKSSTEDVTNTRDISLAGQAKLGYNPVYCNWDSPAGHWKPWCVSGRPYIHDPEKVAASFREGIEASEYFEPRDRAVDARKFNSIDIEKQIEARARMSASSCSWPEPPSNEHHKGSPFAPECMAEEEMEDN